MMLIHAHPIIPIRTSGCVRGLTSTALAYEYGAGVLLLLQALCAYSVPARRSERAYKNCLAGKTYWCLHGAACHPMHIPRGYRRTVHHVAKSLGALLSGGSSYQEL